MGLQGALRLGWRSVCNRNPDTDNLYVRNLYFNDGAWNRNYNWLDDDWNRQNPAALLETLFISPSAYRRSFVLRPDRAIHRAFCR